MNCVIKQNACTVEPMKAKSVYNGNLRATGNFIKIEYDVFTADGTPGKTELFSGLILFPNFTAYRNKPQERCKQKGNLVVKGCLSYCLVYFRQQQILNSVAKVQTKQIEFLCVAHCDVVYQTL